MPQLKYKSARQNVPDREIELARRVDVLERENSQLRARVLCASAVATDARLWDAVHEARGEVAQLRFAIGEVITNYRCSRNASAHGHDALAAEYRLKLAVWIGQCGESIDRPDTLYGRFKTVLTK